MSKFSAIMKHPNESIEDLDDLKSRLQFLRLGEQDCQAIRRIEKYVVRELPHALDRFYGMVRQEPETLAFFSSEDQIERAKRAQLSYWRSISSAHFDLQYANTVRRIGRTHARIGLEPHWYISGYAIILGFIIEGVITQVAPSTPLLPPKITFRQLASSLASLCKAVFLDMDLTISIYTTEAKKLNEEELARLDEAVESERQFVTERFGEVINAIANKDLSHTISGSLSETYAPMRDNLNHAIMALRQTLRTISEATESIDNTADEIDSAAQDLAQRTEKQAASVEKTAAAVEQITATVSSTEARVSEASQFVEECQAITERFGTMIRRAGRAMEEIERSAEAVNKITNVISNIATQTNLLALNTGVEAAHAGEAGSGFRVLAQEIRKLANRVGDASEEVKELITTSQSHVDSGSAIMKDAGGAIDTIISSVANIGTHLKEISKATSEQATALRDVNSAVTSIDQGTRENAAMVEETSAATSNMAQRTRQLKTLLGEFNLHKRD